MTQCNKLKAMLVGLLLVSSGVVIGDNLTGSSEAQQKTTSVNEAKPQETPEDRAYQEEMVRLSNATVQKISEIQAKQKELDNEVYPAYKPPLQGELDNLNKQLEDLTFRKSQLEAQKTARDLSKQLHREGQSSTAQP